MAKVLVSGQVSGVRTFEKDGEAHAVVNVIDMGAKYSLFVPGTHAAVRCVEGDYIQAEGVLTVKESGKYGVGLNVSEVGNCRVGSISWQSDKSDK